MIPTAVCHRAVTLSLAPSAWWMIIPYFYQISGIPSFVWALDIGAWPPEPGPDTRYSVTAALWCLGLGALNHKSLSFLFLSIIFYDLMRLPKNSKFKCSRHVCPLNVPRVQWTQTMCGREEHFRIDTQIMRTLECQLVPITNSAISNGFNTET